VRQKSDVKGALLKGAGLKAFVAGADINELSDLNEFRGAAASERGQEIFSYIESTPKPVIAVIEGYCLGAGCELAMACHLRVAGQGAIFGLPEVTLGLIPGYGGTQRLTKLVGRGRAMEMILTGNHYKADVALAFGLINHLCATGEAYNEARKMLLTILSRAPKAVSAAIKAIKASEQGVREGLTVEADLFGQLCGSMDFREGIAAFSEKRRPVFTGS
jgi:enoyl-CoA hydratase